MEYLLIHEYNLGKLVANALIVHFCYINIWVYNLSFHNGIMGSLNYLLCQVAMEIFQNNYLSFCKGKCVLKNSLFWTLNTPISRTGDPWKINEPILKASLEGFLVDGILMFEILSWKNGQTSLYVTIKIYDSSIIRNNLEKL